MSVDNRRYSIQALLHYPGPDLGSSRRVHGQTAHTQQPPTSQSTTKRPLILGEWYFGRLDDLGGFWVGGILGGRLLGVGGREPFYQ